MGERIVGSVRMEEGLCGRNGENEKLWIGVRGWGWRCCRGSIGKKKWRDERTDGKSFVRN